jgi:hypothetical protein
VSVRLGQPVPVADPAHHDKGRLGERAVQVDFGRPVSLASSDIRLPGADSEGLEQGEQAADHTHPAGGRRVSGQAAAGGTAARGVAGVAVTGRRCLLAG